MLLQTRRKSDEAQGQQQACQANGNIDQEDAAPAQPVNEQTPDNWPGGGGDTGDAGPDPGRLCTLLLCREGLIQQRQRRRDEERRTDALNEAGGDQERCEVSKLGNDTTWAAAKVEKPYKCFREREVL